MRKTISFLIGVLSVALFIFSFATPRAAIAQDHVVAPSDIQKDLAASSSARQQNQSQLETFVSSPEAQRAMKSAHLDASQVKNAIPNLNDDELAELSARSEKAQEDFSAGRLSDRDLIIILLAIVALILIVVAVR